MQSLRVCVIDLVLKTSPPNPLYLFLGTPFMDLLASSLKYWVVQKMNSDPAWKMVRNIISLKLSYLSS